MKRPKAFILMPFDPSFDEVYNLFIADAITEAGYDVFRADNIQSQQNILRDIVDAIYESDIVVADLTTNNANVFYELGLAHAFGKRVILLAQDIEDVPFDLRSYRIVVYSTHFASVRRARSELVDLAKGAGNKTVPFGSPVSDFLHIDGTRKIRIDQSELVSEEEDKGFLDYLADFEQATEELNQTITMVTGELSRIGSKATQASREIDKAKANPSSGTMTHIRKLTQRLAKEVLSFASNLKDANETYTGSLSRIEDGLEYMLSMQKRLTIEDKEQLHSLISTLNVADQQAVSARDSIVGLGDTMNQLHGIERHLTRAAKESGMELQQFVENIDQTTAIFQRARLMARGRLCRLTGSSPARK